MMTCTMVKISHPLILWGLLDGIIKSVRTMGAGATMLGWQHLTVWENPNPLGLYTPSS